MEPKMLSDAELDAISDRAHTASNGYGKAAIARSARR